MFRPCRPRPRPSSSTGWCSRRRLTVGVVLAVVPLLLLPALLAGAGCASSRQSERSEGSPLADGAGDGAARIDAPASERGTPDWRPELSDVGPLRVPLSLWRDGDRDAAIKSFVMVAQESPEPATMLVTDLSEAAFAALSPEQRDQLLLLWFDISRDIRALAQATLEQGRTLAEAGNKAEAEAYYAAVERVGRAHSEADIALLWRQVGDSMIRRASRWAGMESGANG